jgi:hypothetical protein
MVHVPDHDIEDWQLSSANSDWNEGFYASFSGGPASTAVFRLIVTIVLEYSVDASYANMVTMDYPMPGAATVKALIAIFTRYP